MRGKVYLVGAGPGDYKLLTLKGLECIKKADVIIYDRLANINCLRDAKSDCELIYVGKASSNHTLPQDEINREILKKAKEGKIVTRLKGGDPYVFGRGGEEGEILYKEGIDFEVVPGITSAIGGLCYAGIPVTHRDHASSFHVITGHLRDDNKENEELNWNALANNRGTLVFLMGVRNLKKISENLIKEGKPKDTPVALVNWATRYNQKVITSTLEEVHEVAIREKVKPPTLITVGSVVNLRNELNFFENKPLFGKSIIVTRSRNQNSKIVERIMDLGGNPIEIPTIKIDKIENNTKLEKEIKDIKDYNYLVLTSVNAAEIFFEKLESLNLDSRALANLKVCSIGSQTSKYIKSKGIIPDIEPNQFISEALFEELKSLVKKEDKVFIPRGENGREFIVTELSKLCNVVEVYTYKTSIDTSMKNELLRILENCEVDYITFASSLTASNFVEIIGNENIDKLKDIKLISIGPITSGTIIDLGLKVHKEAVSATIDSIIDVIEKD